MEKIGSWWHSLSEGWKGVLVIVSVGTAAASLAIGFMEYKGLPARVSVNEAEIELLQEAGERRDRDVADTSRKLDRVICLLEAQAAARDPIGCSR